MPSLKTQLVSMYHQLYFLPPLSCFYAHLLSLSHIYALTLSFMLHKSGFSWQNLIKISRSWPRLRDTDRTTGGRSTREWKDLRYHDDTLVPVPNFGYKSLSPAQDLHLIWTKPENMYRHTLWFSVSRMVSVLWQLLSLTTYGFVRTVTVS